MIKCTKCGTLFVSEEHLPILIEWEDGEAQVLKSGEFARPGGETFYGCPYCMSELHLTTI